MRSRFSLTPVAYFSATTMGSMISVSCSASAASSDWTTLCSTASGTGAVSLEARSINVAPHCQQKRAPRLWGAAQVGQAPALALSSKRSRRSTS